MYNRTRSGTQTEPLARRHYHTSDRQRDHVCARVYVCVCVCVLSGGGGGSESRQAPTPPSTLPFTLQLSPSAVFNLWPLLPTLLIMTPSHARVQLCVKIYMCVWGGRGGWGSCCLLGNTHIWQVVILVWAIWATHSMKSRHH